MASITKRGAYWRVQVRRKGYPPQAHTFDTKHKAEAWARMVERDMDSGAFVIPDESDHTTLAEALERYWEDIASKKRHPSQERQRINHWLRQHLERPVIEKILTHLGLDPQPPPRGRAREARQD